MVRLLLWITTISVRRPACANPALLEHLLAAMGPAGCVGVLVDRPLTDCGSVRDRRDHEGQPAEDRDLAVACAPATHPS